MSDQQAPVTEVTEVPATSPAVAENTETVQPEIVITKNRFDEVAKRAYEAERKLKVIEAAQAKADEAKLTEQQKFAELYETEKRKAARLEASLTEMQATIRKDKILRAVEVEARKHAFTEPADAFAFINLDSIEIDEATGAVKGADQLVKDLAKAKPYLLTQTTPVQGNGQSPRPAGAAATEEQYKRQLERGLRAL
jgi:hypothetical protein